MEDRLCARMDLEVRMHLISPYAYKYFPLAGRNAYSMHRHILTTHAVVGTRLVWTHRTCMYMMSKRLRVDTFAVVLVYRWNLVS